MAISTSIRLDEQVAIVQAASNGVLTTTVGDCVYVSMKGYNRMSIIIAILNATTVTGAAVTLKQATDVTNSQSDEKALAFTRMLSNVDVAASGTMVETAVTSNTFTTNTTNSKSLLYIIDVKASDLDVANGFDCVRLDCTAANASLGTVTYIMYGARYSGISPLTN